MSKLAHIDPEDLIESQSEGSEEQLPTYLFEDIEEELTKILLLDSGLEETDGAFDVIRNSRSGPTRNIKKKCWKISKKFLHTLTKIFALLLYLKVDTDDKIVTIVNLLISL